MCKVQVLRALVKQRLTAAAEEIFELFERTIAEYEEELSRSREENERQRKILDTVLRPELQLKRADVQQQLVVGEEVPPDQRDWSSSLNQEDPEPPYIKEEQEELWTSQEEADITKFPFTPVPVKSEEDEDKPQSSQLHQRHTEHMETEAAGEDRGGPGQELGPRPNLEPRPGPDRTSDPDRHIQPDNSWKETTEKNKKVHVSTKRRKKPFSCTECGKSFASRLSVKVHMLIHTGEKPFRCTVCGKSCNQKANLTCHMTCHTDEKPFSCSVCEKTFKYTGGVSRHKKLHHRDTLSTSHARKSKTVSSDIHSGPEQHPTPETEVSAKPLSGAKLFK